MKKYIEIVLDEVKRINSGNDVPVVALIYNDTGIISIASNTVEKEKNATKHAEINAINKATEILNTKYLDDCSIIISLEPCIMCLGALINVKIKKIYYFVSECKSGGIGGFINYLSLPNLLHYPKVEKLPNQEYQEILTNFFKKTREKKQNLIQ